MPKDNKTVNISFRVTTHEKDLFLQYCEENDTTPSHELYKFVKNKNRLLNSRLTSSRGYLQSKFNPTNK